MRRSIRNTSPGNVAVAKLAYDAANDRVKVRAQKFHINADSPTVQSGQLMCGARTAGGAENGFRLLAGTGSNVFTLQRMNGANNDLLNDGTPAQILEVPDDNSLQMSVVLNANDNRISNVGTATTGGDAVGQGEQALIDVTDFSTWPDLWVKMGPPSASVLTSPAGSDPAVEEVSTNCRIWTAHADSQFTNDDTNGNGIARAIDLSQAFTMRCKITGSGNFSNAPVSSWYSARLLIFANAGGTAGMWCGADIWFKEAAAENSGDPAYYAKKEFKSDGDTSVTSQGDFTVVQEAKAGDMPTAWLGLDWDPDEGYKAYHSTDGTTWTELGGTTVATGYVYPFEPTDTYQRGQLGTGAVAIMTGISSTIGTAANAIYIDIEQIEFGVSFA